MPTVLKSGSLNLLEPSGPVQASNGTALPFYSYPKSHNRNPVYCLLLKEETTVQKNPKQTLVPCTCGSPLDPQDLWGPYVPHWCVPQLIRNWNNISKWPAFACKDPIFLATTNLLTNDCRYLKLEIYFIYAGCWCFEHTPICVTDSAEWLVTQDSSIIHHNIYTSKLLQSRLYDLVSIHNRIIVCYSLATCQEENKPLCKAAITPWITYWKENQDRQWAYTTQVSQKLSAL